MTVRIYRESEFSRGLVAPYVGNSCRNFLHFATRRAHTAQHTSNSLIKYQYSDNPAKKYRVEQLIELEIVSKNLTLNL